jgi:hypothetical protein
VATVTKALYDYQAGDILQIKDQDPIRKGFRSVLIQVVHADNFRERYTVALLQEVTQGQVTYAVGHQFPTSPVAIKRPSEDCLKNKKFTSLLRR